MIKKLNLCSNFFERFALKKEQFLSKTVDESNARGRKFQGDQDMARILSILDPNRIGRIPFDAFLDFMTRETGDADTAEQMVDSFRILAAGKVAV